MKIIRFGATIILITINFLAFGQQPFDCIDARDVCTNEPIIEDYSTMEVQGSASEGFTNELCDIILTSPDVFVERSIWYRFSFTAAGRFAFRITPNEFLNDVDFVVFKAQNSDCQTLEPVRCSYAGENVGPPIDSTCLGPTGLSVMSNDFELGPGCTGDHNNFLAAIDVNPGDEYYLAVTVFGELFKYTIEFGDDQLFGCVSSIEDKTQLSQSIRLFPNPAADVLHVQNLDLDAGRVVQFYDELGRLVHVDEIAANELATIDFLDRGMYTVVMTDPDGQQEVQRVVVN